MTTRQSEKTLLARAAAHEKWAKCQDPNAATAPARAAFQRRFLDAADPDGGLRLAISKATDQAERDGLEKRLANRVEHARKAYYIRLALESARARRK